MYVGISGELLQHRTLIFYILVFSSSRFGFYDALNILGHCVAFDSERETSDKFSSEALLSA